MERFEFTPEQRSLMEQLQIPFAIYQFIDKRVVTLVLSAGFCSTFGYSDRASAYYDMDHDMYKEAHPDDVARIADAAYRFATEGGTYEVVYRTKNHTAQDGSDYHIIHAVGRHVYTDTGVRLAQVWYTDEGPYTDDEVSQTNAFQQALHHVLRHESAQKSSQYDYMTGLPVMSYFFELAEAGREAIVRSGGQAVLLFLDLCGMKYFNAKHSFAEGDRLIQTVARTLIRFFSNENCCHVGGDHFMVYTKEEGLEELLQQLFYECRMLNGGNSLPMRVGVYPERLEDVPVQVAADRAKIACDALRNTFESRFNYYNKSMTEDSERRQYILSNLDRAIAEQWIQVYYQPIVRAVTGKVCDEEALARWIDPDRGFLSPADFIPFLEDAGQIYKLDLYVLEQVLVKMKKIQGAGLYVVPHSINLSRSDFEVCDIVEEIRQRVDRAGISREKITIEITESVIGSDFDFIKRQIARFQSLGFPVWMDDFGSGYSSLDVLQSVKFDLLKFDMSFMRKLDEGENGKIILTELMRMAGALGVDTVCEGVETEQQVCFLREIGCSKFQGYYFCKPVPTEVILERNRKGIQIGYENPAEADYYESVSRINLFDLSFLANTDDSVIRNRFNAIPMGILEIDNDGGSGRFVRSNQSFRDYARRTFGIDLYDLEQQEHPTPKDGFDPGFMKAVEQCRNTGNRTFVDEELDDGSVVHSFVRRIGTNPVNGRESIAIAVLSITERNENPTYAEIARALASDYYNIYVIDLDTNEYIEYRSQVGNAEMSLERHGGDFFASARRDTMTRIYEADREAFLALFTRETVLRTIEEQGVFTTTYRLTDTGTPMYVNMKVTRMRGGNRLILGVSVIDAHMKEKAQVEQLQKERELLVRVMALSDGYLTLFTVDPRTGHYVEYSSSEDFDSLGAASDGTDFFAQAYEDAFTYCYAPDRQRFQEQVTLENVLQEIQQHGSFSINYHLIIKGVPRPVTLKAALFREGGEDKLVVGVRAWKVREKSDEKQL